MKSKNKQILLVALSIALTCCGVVLGQDSAALTVEPSVSKAPDTIVIANGKKAKATGIVINRNLFKLKYEPTRAFDLRCGYREEARFEGFYAEGDDKLVYSKGLTAR